jgi:hypothetical protein
MLVGFEAPPCRVVDGEGLLRSLSITVHFAAIQSLTAANSEVSAQIHVEFVTVMHADAGTASRMQANYRLVSEKVRLPKCPCSN